MFLALTTSQGNSGLLMKPGKIFIAIARFQDHLVLGNCFATLCVALYLSLSHSELMSAVYVTPFHGCAASSPLPSALACLSFGSAALATLSPSLLPVISQLLYLRCLLYSWLHVVLCLQGKVDISTSQPAVICARLELRHLLVQEEGIVELGDELTMDARR
eukprot:c41479_g1_i1 orf=104-586(-)